MLLVRADVIADAFGLAWQWTRSAYLPYPGYRAAKGRSANRMASSWSAKWCCGALRSRHRKGMSASAYRNFFYPPARWQFSSLRLAEFV